MTQLHHEEPAGHDARASRFALALIGGGALTLLAAGLLLWWREGDKLFTDGLIAAIIACF